MIFQLHQSNKNGSSSLENEEEKSPFQQLDALICWMRLWLVQRKSAKKKKDAANSPSLPHLLLFVVSGKHSVIADTS